MPTASQLYEKALNTKTGRSIAKAVFVRSLPADIRTSVEHYISKGLNLKLAVYCTDHGWPACQCGKPKTVGNWAYKFNDFCTPDCKLRYYRKLLRKSKSSLRLTQVDDKTAYGNCKLCGKAFKKAVGYVLAYGCLCTRSAKISATQSLPLHEIKDRLQPLLISLHSDRVKSLHEKIRLSCMVCSTIWEANANLATRGKLPCPGTLCTTRRKVVCMLEKYGSLNISEAANQQRLRKYKKTCLERYGVEYPNQHREFFDKAVASAYAGVSYKLGRKHVTLQGYEPAAVDILLNYGIKPNQIECGTKANVPSIRYTHKGKRRIYHPDIYIPHLNRIVEVKSAYTLFASYAQNIAKARACKDMGYKFSFLVLDAQGNVLYEKRTASGWTYSSLKESRKDRINR